MHIPKFRFLVQVPKLMFIILCTVLSDGRISNDISCYLKTGDGAIAAIEKGRSSLFVEKDLQEAIEKANKTFMC